MKNQNGFTLIELMVIIVILGILAGVFIPKILGLDYRSKAEQRCEKNNIDKEICLIAYDNWVRNDRSTISYEQFSTALAIQVMKIKSAGTNRKQILKTPKKTNPVVELVETEKQVVDSAQDKQMTEIDRRIEVIMKKVNQKEN